MMVLGFGGLFAAQGFGYYCDGWAALMAWDDLGAGRMLSTRANICAALKTSVFSTEKARIIF